MFRPLACLVALCCLFGDAPRINADDAPKLPLIRWETRQLSDIFFSEGADCGDFNRDGHMDIVSGPFWYAGPDFKQAHPYYEPKPFDPHGYSDNFFAYAEDFNGDGWTDILIIGFPGKDASWFENPQGREGIWPRHVVLDVVDNESPTFIDLTGDGLREIVCSSGGYFGFAEVNRDDPTDKWTFRRISDQSAGGRFTHGLGVGDVNGDGRLDILEKTGWWEQPASLQGDPQWKKHPFPFSGPGGAQMFAFDIDGDGDNDVLTSLAAHGYGLVWYENAKNDAGGIGFTKHVILGEHPEDNPYGVCFSQLHAIDVADIDGDGLLDIIAGKRWWAHGPKGDAEPNAAPVLYWFKLTRTAPGAAGVEFVPHRIHDNSGVGVEVKAKDVNGDGLLDVIVGNKKGTFISLQQREGVAKLEYDRHQPIPPRNHARAVGDGLPPHDGLAPAAAAEAMTAPAGFRVQLAAGEPLVHQPVAFTIDEQGRLWVAEAHTYPKRAPEGQGQDRIIILEDTDLDGVFETRKVFIEGLNLVSGLEVGFGGVWVGAAPYLMFIPDRDGDDVPDGLQSSVQSPVSSEGNSGHSTLNTGHADIPPGATVLLDGWGYQDTHETLNAFIWGPDGWLYGCQGVFTHSKVGKPGAKEEDRTPLNCCVWRYHPTRHEFEVFAHGSSNPWGVDFNDHGQAFITACVIPHMFHVIQGARYQRQGGQHFNPYTYDDIKTIADHAHYAGNIRDHAWWGRNEAVAHNDTHAAGGGHAHCGAMIYLGDNWPTQYRNTIFMANIHGNRVNNDTLKRDGSGFIASHNPDFLYANDRWFRGINLKYGPDGSVYVIDWYDPNACHRNQPEIWDRTNGRIYRVSYGDAKPQQVDLSQKSSAELVELQLHENDWYVRTARRLLQERSTSIRTVLANRRRQNVSGEGAEQWAEATGRLTVLLASTTDPARRLRLLWTRHVLQSASMYDTARLLMAKGSEGEYIRAWGIQLELEDREIEKVVLRMLVDMAKSDPSPIVRLYLASALQRLPLEDRWDIARNLLNWAEDATDHNLPLMVWYGVEPLVPADPDRALGLAEGSKIPLVAQFIYRRAAADPAALPRLLAAIGSTTSDGHLQAMLEEVTTVVKTSGQLAMPEGWPAVYAKLSQHKSPDVRRQAQFITVKFGDKSIFPALREIVADAQADAASRTSALDALVSGKDADLPPILIALLDDSSLRTPILRALAAFDAPETPAAILSRYAKFDDAARQDAIATLASRTPYALALLNAIEQGTIPRADLKAFTVAQMQQLKSDELQARLNAVWGSIRSTPQEKQQEIAQLKRSLGSNQLARADLPHGRELYAKNCGKCHKLFGDGGAIGPDITGSNRANLDYILQNIIDPSALVGKDYQTTTVVTADGRVLNGLIREENETALVLQTATDVIVVDKQEIEERQLSELSLMPEGQLKGWPQSDLQDLIAYLASPRQVALPGAGPVYDEAAQRVAGAIEGEQLKVLSVTAGAARAQPMGGFSKDRWSGVDHLWWTGAKPGDKLVLELPVRDAGRYDLLAVMTKARDYGIVQLSLDDHPLGGPIDLYNNPDVITTGVISLGTHDLTAGPHRLTVEIVGAHQQAAKAYMFGLDYLYLSKPPAAVQ